MTENKHTPGPWRVFYEGGEDWQIYADNGEVGTAWCKSTLFVNAREANARLIAAAPEMLEALRGAIGALEFSRDYHMDLSNEDQSFAQDRLDAALAAIAKVEGRS